MTSTTTTTTTTTRDNVPPPAITHAGVVATVRSHGVLKAEASRNWHASLCGAALLHLLEKRNSELRSEVESLVSETCSEGEFDASYVRRIVRGVTTLAERLADMSDHPVRKRLAEGGDPNGFVLSLSAWLSEHGMDTIHGLAKHCHERPWLTVEARKAKVAAEAEAEKARKAAEDAKAEAEALAKAKAKADAEAAALASREEAAKAKAEAEAAKGEAEAARAEAEAARAKAKAAEVRDTVTAAEAARDTVPATSEEAARAVIAAIGQMDDPVILRAVIEAAKMRLAKITPKGAKVAKVS